jgi:hypothetical protein
MDYNLHSSPLDQIKIECPPRGRGRMELEGRVCACVRLSVSSIVQVPLVCTLLNTHRPCTHSLCSNINV